MTWVTYAPCFLWIFLGAPHIEALRGNIRLSGRRKAVTAAVVVVIANLTVFFAVHTLFGSVDGRRRYGWLQIDVPQWQSPQPPGARRRRLRLLVAVPAQMVRAVDPGRVRGGRRFAPHHGAALA